MSSWYRPEINQPPSLAGPSLSNSSCIDDQELSRPVVQLDVCPAPGTGTGAVGLFERLPLQLRESIVRTYAKRYVRLRPLLLCSLKGIEANLI